MCWFSVSNSMDVLQLCLVFQLLISFIPSSSDLIIKAASYGTKLAHLEKTLRWDKRKFQGLLRNTQRKTDKMTKTKRSKINMSYVCLGGFYCTATALKYLNWLLHLILFSISSQLDDPDSWIPSFNQGSGLYWFVLESQSPKQSDRSSETTS